MKVKLCKAWVLLAWPDGCAPCPVVYWRRVTILWWNRSADKCAPLPAAGAKQAADLAACVPTVKSSCCVHCQYGCGGRSHCAFVAAPACRAGDLDFLHCAGCHPRAGGRSIQRRGLGGLPVSGGVPGAEAGSLAMMAGGDARVIDQLRPLLANLVRVLPTWDPMAPGKPAKYAIR